jgi:hypothetical protein
LEGEVEKLEKYDFDFADCGEVPSPLWSEGQIDRVCVRVCGMPLLCCVYVVKAVGFFLVSVVFNGIEITCRRCYSLFFYVMMGSALRKG